MEIPGKVALVTGAGRRVGKAIALALAQEGTRIGLHYNSSQKLAKEVELEIEELGGEACLLQGDFSKLDAVKNVVSRCHEHFGQLDILINNAAVYYKTPLTQVTEQEWDQFLDINLKAPFFCAKFAAEVMQAGGKIVNITDVSGFTPWADYLPYCVSKAGLISATKGLAKALAPNIQVNGIAPGTVLLEENASEAHAQAIKKGTLLGEIGSPKDIADTVVFLLKAGDYITGEVISVDGGSRLA